MIPIKIRFLQGSKECCQREHREGWAGAGEPAGEVPNPIAQKQFNRQAAGILLRTPLKPRKWSTLLRHSPTVHRISSIPRHLGIHRQAAAIPGPRLQNEKHSSDFCKSQIRDSRFAPPKGQAHDPCTGCSDPHPRALIRAPCAWISLAGAPRRLSRHPQEIPTNRPSMKPRS